MATIVVETGAVVPGANSYVSVADLTAYATDRGITVTGTKADLLIEAMDYIEAQNFKGLKYTKAQPLQWPRINVVIDGYTIDADEIPQLLIDAVCETALAIDAGNSPIANIERKTVRETVGEISVEYASGSNSDVVVQKINTKLNKLLTSGSGGMSFEVFRA